MIEAQPFTMGEQLLAWSVLLGLLIVALAFGAWREERQREAEDAERRERVRREFGDGH